MGKLLSYGKEARDRVFSGVDKLARTVRVTMGPRGRNVIVGKSIGAPSITKDGVSVAREIVLDDPIEELGCQLVKEAAGRTAAVAGDGTTTATVLTHAILEQGRALMDSDYNPIAFRNGMEWAKEALLNEIRRTSKPLDDDNDLFNVATISVNNDTVLGRVIADAYIAAGRTGMVTAEARPGVVSSYRVVDGIELSSGFISPMFLNDGEGKRQLSNAKILILDWDITTHMDTDFQSMIKLVADERSDVLLVCRSLQKEGLSFFAGNFKAGRLSVCPIKIPKFGKNQNKWLEDFAALTGASIVGGECGIPMSDFSAKDLGHADAITIDSYLTKIVGPHKNAAVIDERIRLYNDSLIHLLGDTERQDILGRLGFLTGKTAVITVGYSTELELREKGDRVEDALFAVKAAIKSGYVVGGGFALWNASRAIEARLDAELPKEQHEAAKALLEAVKAPARQIIANAGLDPEKILKEVVGDSDFGYNTATGIYENLIDAGVIDPALVTQTALENATSIATLLLTTDAVIADNPNQQSGWQPPAAYRLPEEGKLNHKH